MTEFVIVVDRLADFVWDTTGRQVMTTRDYVANPPKFEGDRVRVLNLSRSYSYLGYGYYCSLLGEARRHTVIPTVKTIMELSQRGIYLNATPELEKTLHRTMSRLRERPEGHLLLTVFFGLPDDPRFERVARQAFDTFRVPILRLRLKEDPEEGWWIQTIRAVSIGDLKEYERDLFEAGLDAYTRIGWPVVRARKGPRYRLAILHDPKEVMAPSDMRALKKFIRVGDQMDIAVDLITKQDYARLVEYDALLIRETTALDHHTFRFAKKAEKEGMPVMDDPTSILRCCNKVYLHELLSANGVPTPKTQILDRREAKKVRDTLNYPVVLKVPDGSFSRGIFKVANVEAFREKAKLLFEDSDIILAQEFMYTSFDWRIGVLNKKPLFACQYAMAKGHWQIINHGAKGGPDEGRFVTMPVEQAPKEVIKLAVKAASLIGEGLYGVDLKQNDQGVFVIEVNDNPNLDGGIEDKYLKDELYKLILEEFLRRLKKGTGASA